MKIEDAIKRVLVETGRAGINYRVKVTKEEEVRAGSDRIYVYCDVYKPRSRKPDVAWRLCVDIVRNLIFWEDSQFTNSK